MDRISGAYGQLVNWLVALLTFTSIFLILAFWLRIAEGTLFWAYSISTTGFLLFMYLGTWSYRPVPDLGFRPKLTVVVPVKNEVKAIDAVLRTVFDSDYPEDRMEVVVVDDGSTDGTWDEIQKARTTLGFPGRLVTVRHERNYGKRVALASAVARAKGDVIVCIDSDSFVDREAVKLLVQPFRDRDVAAVSGHGEAVNKEEGLLPKLQHYWYAETFRLMKAMESRLGCVSCCSGMLAAYRRSAILPIINEWLKEKSPPPRDVLDSVSEEDRVLNRGLWGRLLKSPGEDRILTAFALSKKDARTVYQSNAIVHTIVPDNPRQFLKQQLRWNRAWIHGSILSSTFMWKKPFASALVHYLYQFVSFLSPVVVIWWLIVDPLKGQWMGALGFIVGTMYVGLLHGLNSWRRLDSSIESIAYRMMFVLVSFFLTATVLVYGWATPWKMTWVTRGSKNEERPVAEPIPLLQE